MTRVALSELEHSSTHGLVALGQYLKEMNYCFVTVSPESHQRFLNQNPESSDSKQYSATLRDLFGWNKSVDPNDLSKELLEVTQGLLAPYFEEKQGRVKSLIRFSTHRDLIFAHSGFPTESEDSVFFGPDTYRFFNFLEQYAPKRWNHLVDVGCGSGAGGLFLKSLHSENSSVTTLIDINPKALLFSQINSELNGFDEINFAESNLFSALSEKVDLIIANPPFMMDELGRSYRDGGGNFGTDLSQEIVKRSLQKLSPGGQLLLYTASPIVDGVDTLKDHLSSTLQNFRSNYFEIDPDIFNSELSASQYQGVERLAAVGLCLWAENQ